MGSPLLGGTMGGGEGNHHPPSHLSRPLVSGEETAVSPYLSKPLLPGEAQLMSPLPGGNLALWRGVGER